MTVVAGPIYSTATANVPDYKYFEYVQHNGTHVIVPYLHM